MTPDSELVRLRAKRRKARQTSPEALEAVTLSICRARASTLTGLLIQAVVLCELLESAAPQDARAITLARNVRQSVIAMGRRQAVT